jgi:hypothetical protein
MSQAFETTSIHRRPLAFSALLIGAAVGAELLVKATTDLLSLQLSVITVGINSGAVLSVLAALVIARLGVWDELGATGRPARWRTLLWFLPFAVYGILPLTQSLDVTAGKVAGAAAFGVLVALWKFTVLGLLLYAWRPCGGRAAAGRTGFFWGAMHLGADSARRRRRTHVPGRSLLCVPGVRIRRGPASDGLIWPMVVTYALLLTTAAAVHVGDSANLVASVSDVMPALTVSLLLAVYGFVVLRRPSATTDPTGQPSEPLTRSSARLEIAGRRPT